jgi:hypothetical protein
MAAVVTAKATQAVRQHAAAQEVLKCVLDKSRNASVLAGLLQEARQVLCDDAIQHRLLRIALRIRRDAHSVARPKGCSVARLVPPAGAKAVRIALKRAFADGTLAVEMNPLSLLCRLAITVPPPRFHTVKFAQHRA